MTDNLKVFKLRCRPLTPLHIGAGAELEPLDYIIKNSTFYRISLEDLIANAPEDVRDKLMNVIELNDVTQLRRFIASLVDPEKQSIFSAGVTSDIEQTYNDKFDDISNQLFVQAFIRDVLNNRAYLPGSSLKGAIRTAVLNELAGSRSLINKKDGRKIEAEILDCATDKGFIDAKRDPFRAVKIRDVVLPGHSTFISRVTNVAKPGETYQELSIQMICEITHSVATGYDVEFETELTIDEGLQRHRSSRLRKKMTLSLIRDACTKFYQDKLIQDHKFYLNTPIEPVSERLCREKFNGDSFLLRVGRYSGFQSVTLDGYRRSNKGPGNTKNVADLKYPLGWLKVMIVN